jgi:hypothetical protein
MGSAEGVQKQQLPRWDKHTGTQMFVLTPSYHKFTKAPSGLCSCLFPGRQRAPTKCGLHWPGLQFHLPLGLWPLCPGACQWTLGPTPICHKGSWGLVELLAGELWVWWVVLCRVPWDCGGGLQASGTLNLCPSYGR